MRDDPDRYPDPLDQRTEVVGRSRRRADEAPDDRHEDAEHDRFAEQVPLAPTQVAIVRLARLIYFVFGVIEALIAIRFLLKLFGANAQSTFTSVIYGVTDPLTAPFMGVFANPTIGTHSVLELTSLLAIIVYALVSFGLVRLLYVFAD